MLSGGITIPLQLDHTIVPAYDKVKSAEFIARVFGLQYEGRGFYFECENGHVWEVITHTYITD